jgi:hypothetical protein
MSKPDLEPADITTRNMISAIILYGSSVLIMWFIVMSFAIISILAACLYIIHHHVEQHRCLIISWSFTHFGITTLSHEQVTRTTSPSGSSSSVSDSHPLAQSQTGTTFWAEELESDDREGGGHIDEEAQASVHSSEEQNEVSTNNSARHMHYEGFNQLFREDDNATEDNGNSHV